MYERSKLTSSPAAAAVVSSLTLRNAAIKYIYINIYYMYVVVFSFFLFNEL